VKEPRIDPEQVAALLDGRLDEQRRTELLACIAASEEGLDVLADTAAVLRELEGPCDAEDSEGTEPASLPGDGGIIPLHPPFRRRRWPVRRWAALAAALAAVALVPVLWSRLHTPDPRDPGRPITLLAETGVPGLPAGWSERPWRLVRGSAASLVPEARAARLGALQVDLELAVGARDSAAASQLVGEIETLLADVPASGPVMDEYRVVARRIGEPPARLAGALAEARTGMAVLAGEERVALGAWAEAGRVAASLRDVAFFRDRATRAAFEWAASLPSLGEPARTAAERIRSATRAEGAPDWGTLEHDLSVLLTDLAS